MWGEKKKGACFTSAISLLGNYGKDATRPIDEGISLKCAW